jgi:hypothetical protein
MRDRRITKLSPFLQELPNGRDSVLTIRPDGRFAGGSSEKRTGGFALDVSHPLSLGLEESRSRPTTDGSRRNTSCAVPKQELTATASAGGLKLP